MRNLASTYATPEGVRYALSQVAEGALRKAIGATDPAEAEAGTVRKLFAESKERNAIHASDSDDNAAREARFFFAEADTV